MSELSQTPEFSEWLDNLRDERARTIILARIARLQRGLGDTKPVGGGVWELRIDFGPGYRAYYVERGGALIILLCGGDKDSQQRDIRRAQALAKET